jgi:hypothetical protein
MYPNSVNHEFIPHPQPLSLRERGFERQLCEFSPSPKHPADAGEGGDEGLKRIRDSLKFSKALPYKPRIQKPSEKVMSCRGAPNKRKDVLVHAFSR